jgi:enterochelin esterase-like enzyme
MQPMFINIRFTPAFFAAASTVVLLGALVAAGATTLEAQAQPAAPPAQAQAPVRSPEVSADRRITFRLNAPKATNVSVSFDEGDVKTFPMTKDAAGVWSVTIGPVDPEIYIYNFVVDGLRVLDLLNTNLKSGVALASNIVEVPGTPARFDEVQNVAHGGMVMHTYRSSVQNANRGLYVYVPAEYYTQPTRRYPVLYLYHGGGGYEGDWSRDGRAGVILDNLIEAKRAVPMIIVMPNNTLVGQAPAPVAPAAPGPPASAATLGRELLTDIIPFIEKHYRVETSRERRAIAGLSAGGGTAFTVGMNNLATFATVAEFSTGMFGGTGAVANAPNAVNPEVIVPGVLKNGPAMAKQLKLLYMSCGAEDPRIRYQRETKATLEKSGYAPVFMEFKGAHVWKVWRHSLNDFAPRLFR